MDPKETALVLIEFQNDFTSEGGSLHDAVKAVMESTDMLANTVEMVEKARQLGVTIVHTPISLPPVTRENASATATVYRSSRIISRRIPASPIALFTPQVGKVDTQVTPSALRIRAVLLLPCTSCWLLSLIRLGSWA